MEKKNKPKKKIKENKKMERKAFGCEEKWDGDNMKEEEEEEEKEVNKNYRTEEEERLPKRTIEENEKVRKKMERERNRRKEEEGETVDNEEMLNWVQGRGNQEE